MAAGTHYAVLHCVSLHFLSWVPGQSVRPVHSVPIFGDDCVDSKVTISMAQWKHNSGVLVVYGIAVGAGQSVRPVHSVPIFGDDCVDSNVTISLAQWKHNSGVLVVYGIA
ncbi:Uncharacterized protein OBRU01_09919 [Operophtera brumata]|uniref:DDB1- and CUL4-associated factor 15 WD40 repeat-containing domain-containing protein n=1 Tax=Operophtera brumata TaxID=104452 RepID=A0A0L7LFS5_OPEBR|nr:Uncharacterized protein OBRU01_09919 [Operophtera brumata]